MNTAESTEQLRLSTEELARARTLLAEFRTNHPSYSHLELLESNPNDSYLLTKRACALFEVEVVLYEPISTLHGVTEGNCIFLSGYGRDVSGYRPLWTAGHEVSHVLGLKKPDEHADLVSYIMQEGVQSDGFDRRSTIEKMAQGYLRLTGEKPVPEGWESMVNEEVVADIAGNFWQDTRFWADMGERDRNVFRRRLYAEIISRLEIEKPRPYRAWALDKEAVRDKFVEHMLLFLPKAVEPVQPAVSQG